MGDVRAETPEEFPLPKFFFFLTGTSHIMRTRVILVSAGMQGHREGAACAGRLQYQEVQDSAPVGKRPGISSEYLYACLRKGTVKLSCWVLQISTPAGAQGTKEVQQVLGVPAAATSIRNTCGGASPAV